MRIRIRLWPLGSTPARPFGVGLAAATGGTEATANI